MEIVLLGTGAADGWPNPFCECRSCRTAVDLGAIRGPTAALVDDTMLLDCGPEAPGAAIRHGRSLARLRHLLITHAHVDHCAPQALLYRTWAMAASTEVTGASTEVAPQIDVVGPPAVIDTCRDWIGPGDPVRLITVRPGDTLELGDHTVRVLPARHRVFHDGDAVLYDVTGGAGERLLWATDTGLWPPEWFETVRDADYDMVFLEETFGDRTDLGDGHLDLAGFANMSTGLRDVGAVTARTDVVAVHLGHHNPPEPVLAQRLSEIGARPGRDGEVIVTAGDAVREPAGHRSLVLGGVRSGKSRYAQSLVSRGYDATRQGVTFIAPGESDDGDPEWSERVAEHRAHRPPHWSTIESADIAGILGRAAEPVIVDCLGTWLTARMDALGLWEADDLAPIHTDIDELVAAWRACRVTVVAVSNEVGSGVVPDTRSGRLFRDLLGRINSEIAAASDSVTLMVAGTPMRLR